jgi:voltage-gated potassium channel
MNDLSTQAKNTFFWTISLITVSIIPTFLLFSIEKDVNPDITGFESIYWWWIVTISSVGYGDITPVTFTGKILASIVIIVSLFILALTVVEISTLFKMYILRQKKGYVDLNYENHIVIINYNPTLTFLVKKLRNKLGKEVKIVLISETLEYNPLPGEIDFVRSDLAFEDAVKKSNILKSKIAIFLTKDNYNIPESISILLANEIERRNPEIITVAELIDIRFKSLIYETKIDDYFSRNELINEYIDKDVTSSDLDRILNKAFPEYSIPIN